MKLSLLLLGLLVSFASLAADVPSYKVIKRIDPYELSGKSKNGLKKFLQEQELLVKTRHNFDKKINSSENLAGISCFNKKSDHIWNFSNLVYNAHMVDIVKINGRDARVFYYSVSEALKNHKQYRSDKGRIALLKTTSFNQTAAVTVIMNKHKEIIEIHAQGLDSKDPIENSYCVSKSK